MMTENKSIRVLDLNNNAIDRHAYHLLVGRLQSKRNLSVALDVNPLEKKLNRHLFFNPIESSKLCGGVISENHMHR